MNSFLSDKNILTSKWFWPFGNLNISIGIAKILILSYKLCFVKKQNIYVFSLFLVIRHQYALLQMLISRQFHIYPSRGARRCSKKKAFWIFGSTRLHSWTKYWWTFPGRLVAQFPSASVAERLKTWELLKLQNSKKISEILGTDGEHPTAHPRGKFRQFC